MRHFLILIAAVCAAPALAQEVDCETAMTQYEMNHCAYEAYLAADEDLNATYIWSLDVAYEWSNDAAMALRDAQRAWIPYRDAACVAAASRYEGGSIQPLIEYSCLDHLTRQRTQELRNVYEGP
ncbi:lysozyme inhibitor LprI family protein [Celeribacter sp.]|uniref:lysozyme inhibitor LprI family protein n=1 Tax=Celeribacter sp. TaxID=1890673 RepID=UPI003A8D6676